MRAGWERLRKGERPPEGALGGKGDELYVQDFAVDLLNTVTMHRPYEARVKGT